MNEETTQEGEGGPVLLWITALALLAAMVAIFIYVPTEKTEGPVQRIMYFHIPSAWVSFLAFFVVFLSSILFLWKKEREWDIYAQASAEVGVLFCTLVLITGPIWARPIWGAWWVWDARLTSELILLFLYFGYMALQSAIDDQRSADKASGLLAIVGVVNIPIIHYSVEWWNTLHQGATVAKFDKPSMHIDMLIPLLVMALAFKLFYAALVLVRTRNEALYRDRNRRWVRELINDL
jgi:heme exporter protein C